MMVLVTGYSLLTKFLRATPEKFVVASTIFSILWVIAVVVAFSVIKPGPSSKYTCNKGNCVVDPNGTYKSLEDCAKSCKAPGPSSKYTCNKGNCVVDPNGTYLSSEECAKNCKAANTVLDVDYLTIEYNPTDYSASDTISPWFNDSIKMMGKGDVAVLMTDYMNIHDTILDNMKVALQKGAKFVLGADRWYVCGTPFTCDGSNECPSSDCTSKDPKPVGCYCNIPQAGGCASFNKILTQLEYCTTNKNNIIVVDQPSNKDDNEIWGHAHRKIVNFYYKSSDKARLICGSWNIDAELNRQNLGVKETSLGIATQLSGGFAQYMLQMDIDTLTPIMTYEPTVAAVASTLLPVLTSLKKEKGYPNLPLSCTVKWTDNTPGYTSSKGTDDNVEVWLGISPPPVNPANEFTSPKGVVYGDNSPPDGDDKWQAQYKAMVQKSSLCTPGGTGDNGNKTFASYCTPKGGKRVSLDFATGGTWSGLLFQKFFDQSKSSPFINVSMYIGFDIGAPCDYLSGTWGWGCSGGTYHGPGWFQHQFPLLFPAIRDYVSNTNSSIRIMTGEYNSTNDSGWTPWIWDTAFPSLPQDEQKRIHWKWFNQGRNGPDLSCTNDCGSSRCCRNHEKLYMSDDNILVSSGHPERGYYSDINGINSDILFLKAKGLAGVFNSHFKTQWQKQGVTINSKTDHTKACTNKDGCWINPKWDIYTAPVSW